jgi:hypothetical protein
LTSLTIDAKIDPVKAEKIKIRKNDKATCSIDSYRINVALELSPEEKYQMTLKLVIRVLVFV